MTDSLLLFQFRALDKSEHPEDQRQREGLREKIIGDNMSLVETVVRRVFPSLGLNAGNDFDDVLAEGYVALIGAVDSYDLDYGVPFVPFAAIRIAYHIREFARNDGELSPRRSGHTIETTNLCDFAFSIEDFSSDWIGREALRMSVAKAFQKVEAALTSKRDRDAWERQRRAIDLRFFQHQTMLAVGLDLGVSPEAAKKLLDRGLDRLRPHLAKLLAE